MADQPTNPSRTIPLTLIDEPGEMARMEIDHLYIAELAQSIKEIGQLQDILLAEKGERFEVVAGHCRFLAHQKAGLTTISAKVRKMTRDEIAIARVTENLARKDLTPIEEAANYKNLIDEHGLTVYDVSKKVGKSPGLVKRRMDLLRMPPVLQEAVHKKRISMSVAEELWPISDPAQLDYYLTFALDGGCTKEVARSWCKEWQDSVRRAKSAGGGGGQDFAPSEPRPVYVSCDLCTGPMEIGSETIIRTCPKCFKLIKENM